MLCFMMKIIPKVEERDDVMSSFTLSHAYPLLAFIFNPIQSKYVVAGMTKRLGMKIHNVYVDR